MIVRYGTSNMRIYAIMVGHDDKLIRNHSAIVHTVNSGSVNGRVIGQELFAA